MARGRLLLALLPVLALACLLAVDVRATVLGLFSDDAFYYLKIARSIADGHGTSFDGIAPTNGYHPLWMLCTVALQHLAGSGMLAPIVLSLLLSGLLCGFTLTLFQQATERWLAPGFGATAVALCLSPLLLGAMTNGLETGLLLLSIAGFVWCSCRYELLAPAAGLGARFVLGLLLGLVFLCRLDSVFVVLAAGVLVLASGLLARTPLRTLVLGCAAMVGGVLVCALPFFAWNQANFGRLMPISGLVKSSFPALRPQLALEGDMRFGLALVSAAVLVALAVAAIDRRRGRTLASILASPLAVLSAGAAGHFAYTFCFMTWGVYWWHFVADGTALVLGAAELSQRVSIAWPASRPALRSALPLLAGLGGLALQGWLSLDKLGRHREWYAGAQWAREHTPAGAVFAMKDAGLFSYFSGRAVVNLDGKANSYEYLAELGRGEVRAYLERAQVRYVADVNAAYVDGRAAIAIPRVSQPGLLLWMPLADEIYHGAPYPGRLFMPQAADATRIAIWEFRSPH